MGEVTEAEVEAAADAILWSRWSEEGDILDAAWLDDIKGHYPEHHDDARRAARAALTAAKEAGRGE